MHGIQCYSHHTTMSTGRNPTFGHLILVMIHGKVGKHSRSLRQAKATCVIATGTQPFLNKRIGFFLESIRIEHKRALPSVLVPQLTKHHALAQTQSKASPTRFECILHRTQTVEPCIHDHVPVKLQPMDAKITCKRGRLLRC